MLITAKRMWLGAGKVRNEWAFRVEDDKITAVGPLISFRPDAYEVIDYGDACLLPGLVNAHCHLDQGHLRERVSAKGGYAAWLERMHCKHEIPSRSIHALERIRSVIQLGAGELLSHGTTTVFDVSSSGLPADILTGLPLRAFCALECSSAEGCINQKTIREYLAGGQTDLLKRIVIPHSLFLTNFTLLQQLAQADYHKGHPSLHLAQVWEERELLDQGMGLLRPVVERLNPQTDLTPTEGLWGRLKAFYPPIPGFLVVHGHCLKASELQALSKIRANLVLCMQSHEHLGFPCPDFQAILDRKVNVALGTESLAVGHTLSMWREMACLKALQPSLHSGIILRWATLGGAKALGLPTGILKPGMLADWVAADTSGVDEQELEDHLVQQEPEVLGVGTGGIVTF